MILARTATQANISPAPGTTAQQMTFSPGLTFSTPIQQGDAVLFKEQSDPSQNGVWVCSSVDRKVWKRHPAADTWNKHVGLRVHITAGILSDEIWFCEVDVGGTLSVTPVTFVKESDASTGPLEVLTSIPRKRPPHLVRIDATPHGAVVAESTTYGTYVWDEERLDDDPTKEITLPAAYHHGVGEELTFRATVQRSVELLDIVEVYFDFGDGVEAQATFVSGNNQSQVWEAKHTYKVASPGIIAHCRVRDNNGDVSHASMNMMLKTTLPPPLSSAFTPYYTSAFVHPFPMEAAASQPSPATKWVSKTYALRPDSPIGEQVPGVDIASQSLINGSSFNGPFRWQYDTINMGAASGRQGHAYFLNAAGAEICHMVIGIDNAVFGFGAMTEVGTGLYDPPAARTAYAVRLEMTGATFAAYETQLAASKTGYFYAEYGGYNHFGYRTKFQAVAVDGSEPLYSDNPEYFPDGDITLTDDGDGYYLRYTTQAEADAFNAGDMSAHNEVIDFAFRDTDPDFTGFEATMKVSTLLANNGFGDFEAGMSKVILDGSGNPSRVLFCYFDSDYIEVGFVNLVTGAYTYVGNGNGDGYDYFYGIGDDSNATDLYSTGVFLPGDGWVRMRLLGSKLTVEAFRVDPETNPGAAPCATVGYTLTAQQIADYGAAVPGKVGIGLFAPGGDGGQYIDYLNVTAPPASERTYAAPVADFILTANNSTFRIGYDGRVSTGESLDYAWTCTHPQGPNYSGDPGNLSAAFAFTGTYSITLTVTDRIGRTSSVTKSFTFNPITFGGSKVAFVSSGSGDDVYTINPITAPNPAPATIRADTQFVHWASAAHSTKIAYATFENGDTIRHINYDGTGDAQIYDTVADSVYGMAYKPGSTASTWTLLFQEAADIKTINQAGTVVTLATETYAPGLRPQAWKPDGTQFIYAHYQELVRRNANGTGRTVLFDASPLGLAVGGASYSPDGTKIAWWTSGGGFSGDRIHIMNADGTGDIDWTTANSPHIFSYGVAGAYWSPDGAFLAVMTSQFNTTSFIHNFATPATKYALFSTNALIVDTISWVT